MSRFPLWLLLLPALATVALVGRAEDAPGIPADKLKQAEATYADVFGATHEQLLKSGKPAEKGEFAKKLADRAKEAKADPALQEVLRRNALVFAQNDPAGVALAVEIYKRHLAVPERKAAALDKIGEWLEKGVAFEQPTNRARAAGEAIQHYRTAAAEWEKTGNPASAVAALGKARAAVRKFTPTARDVLAALDADEKRLATSAADQIELDKLRAAVEKSPNDPAARLALGIAHLKQNKPAPAAEHLLMAKAEPWAALAKALAGNAPAETAGAALKAAATLPADDKKQRHAVLEFARAKFDEVRAAGPEKWLAVRADYLAALEQLALLDPPATAGKHAGLLASALLELADEQAGRKEFAAALVTVGKARAAAKGMKPADARDLQPALDATEKWVKGRAVLETDAARFAEMEKANATDAKSNLAFGLALLRLGKPVDASIRLAQAGGKPWDVLAKLLAVGEVAAPLELADAIRAAAVGLKGDEKTDLLVMAREKYEAFLAVAPKDAPERTRVGLVLKELPVAERGRTPDKTAPTAGTVIDLFDDAAALSKAFKESTVDGKVEVTTSGGHVLVAARGNDIQMFVPKARVVSVVESPSMPGEFRYCGFWIRHDGRGTDYSLQLRRDTLPEIWYGLQPNRVTANTSFVRVLARPSSEWQFVIRDVYADVGSKPTKVVNVDIGNRTADGTTWVSHLYFATGRTALDKASARKPPK